MNTTAAALQADVTVDTIRHWCRYGAVAATKAAGRWVIDATSLARRIALSARRALKTAKAPKIEYTIDTMTAIGGRRWTKAGHDRVYLKWENFTSLEISHYNTGNISSAAWQGETISNAQGGKILGSIYKVYFDVHTGKLHCQYGRVESRVVTRQEVRAEVVAGIRAAIAAL